MGAREMCMCAYFAPHTFYASNMQVTLSFRTRRSSILPCQFSAIFLTGNADLSFSLSLGEEHHARIYSFLCKNKQTRQNKVRTLKESWPACRRGVILSRFSDEQRRAWSARGVLSRASRAPRSTPTSSLPSTVWTGWFENETGCFPYFLLKTHDCGVYHLGAGQY